MRLPAHINRVVRALLVLLACGAASRADTISLPAVADTSLYQGNPDGNLGATTLVSGTNQKNSVSRALFSFDLSSIPGNAIINEAHVSLAVTKRPDPDQHGGPIPSDFGLYRLLVSWGEGSGTAVTGSPTNGGATWSARFFPLVSWDYVGGSAGVDYVDSPSSSTLVDDLGIYVFQNTPLLVQDVESWVNSPETNFGFMLISNNESTLGTGRRFASREQATGTFPAPTLTVDYIVPEPSAGLLAGIALTGLACFLRPASRQVDRSACRVT